MSIATFVADPVAYIKGHYVQFYGASGNATQGGTGPDASAVQLVNTFDNWAGAWKAKVYALKPNLYPEFRFVESMSKADSTWGHRVGSDKLHSITCFPSTVDQGIRFLPWEANHVTCMAIDPAATSFYTGPLQGCAIYFGQEPNGTWWAFHANRNNSGSIDNNAIKTSMTINTIPLLGTSITVKHYALYGAQYTDQGFVFGTKKGSTWTFHAANLALSASGKFSMTLTKLA